MLHYSDIFLKNKIPWSQIFACLIVCLLHLGNGLQAAWPSPSIPILIAPNSTIPLTLEQTSYFGILPCATSILCSPIFSKLIDKIGRKHTLLLIAVPQILAWLVVRFSSSLETLYCARILSGISEAGTFISVPIYTAEIVQSNIRGRLVSVAVIFSYSGQLMINIIGSYNSIKTTALICCTVPIIFFICFVFCPESPYYLLMKNRTERAEHSLRKLRKNFDQVEMEILKIDVKRQMSETKSIKDLFLVSSNRKALILGIGLRSTHQFSGISAFTVYNQYMFQISNTPLSSATASIIFFGLQAALAICSSLVIDKIGRRPLLLFSNFSCTTLLTTLMIYFYLFEYTDTDLALFSWVPVVALMLFIIVFSLGFGTVPNLILSEIFSVNMKGKALSLINIYYSLCFIVTSKVFQLMIGTVGMAAAFFFFAFGSFLCCLFCYYCVPETKGKRLEEIQQYFKSVSGVNVKTINM